LQQVLPIIFRILDILLWAYMLLLVIRIAFSWFRVSSWSRPVLLVYALTDPVMEPLRKLRFLRVGQFDFSATLALILILILKDFILPWLELLIIKH